MKIQSVFDFKSNSEPYIAEAAVVCCFDARIRRVTREFLEQRGILKPDMIVIAGGALSLASPRAAFHRDFVLDQVRLSLQLHQPKRIILMSHSDCATYGGLARFNGNRGDEMTHHKSELQNAESILRIEFPQIKVESFFISFEGVFALG